MSLPGVLLIFLYVASFTIGGGLVAIPLLQQEVVGRDLITMERFYAMIAVSESTPGPIVTNLATYIGCELFGPFGGILTTLATVLPSLIGVLLIIRLIRNIDTNQVAQAAFYGLRAGSTGLIAVAVWQILNLAIFRFSAFRSSGLWTDIASWPALTLFVLMFAISRKFDWHPFVFIAIGATCGVLFL
jgi:chromate transporter